VVGWGVGVRGGGRFLGGRRGGIFFFFYAMVEYGDLFRYYRRLPDHGMN